MKKVALGAAAIVLLCGYGSAFAAEKPTLEERCKAIAEQHGMKAEEIDAWVEKCMDHTKAMMHRHKDDESSGRTDQPANGGQQRNGGADK